VYVFYNLVYYIVIQNLNVMLLTYFLYSLLFYRMYGEALFCEFCAQEEYHLSLFHTTQLKKLSVYLVLMHMNLGLHVLSI